MRVNVIKCVQKKKKDDKEKDISDEETFLPSKFT